MDVTRAPEQIRLDLGGMTCAACAARIEKRLNRVDGVTATVNFATETAAVTFDPQLVDPATLVAAVESIGYRAVVAREPGAPAPAAAATGAAGTPERDPYGQRLVGAAILGMPVLVLSMVPALQFRNWQWVAFALASPVATWAAWPFHRAAWRNLRQAEASMDTLVSVGVGAAYLWSTVALLFTSAGDNDMRMDMAWFGSGAGADHHLYLEVASTTVALILLGRWFEARAKRRAGSALRALLARGSFEASVLDADGTEHRRPSADIRVGERFVVRPGESIATDGVVVDGASSIDTSLVTGESLPRDVALGDAVIGATINVTGRIVVRATRVGADTTLAQMARLVADAQSGKAPVQRLADRVSAVFVPVVVALAVATLGFWWGRTGAIDTAIGPAMAVLIIACPCALGLATPTALLVGTGRGAQLGILIRGPEVLESTRRVDTVVLDKTGTITSGEMSVVAVDGCAPGWTDDAVLGLAAAVESASEHPIARSVVAHARAAGIAVGEVRDFVNEPGHGARGMVRYGEGWAPAAVRRAGAPIETATPGTLVELEVDGQVVGRLTLADTVKPTSRDGIAALRALGLRPMLLTGDHLDIAIAVADDVGIDRRDVRAGVLPADKLSVVRDLQGAGAVVAMVGDGVNDAAALAAADLGIAMGSGTDVAIEASDLTLMRAEIPAVADAIQLSRRTLRTIVGNLVWAFAYNVAAIPVAAAGLLSPVIASAAMAFSSVFVVTNSLRLRRFGRTAG